MLNVIITLVLGLIAALMRKPDDEWRIDRYIKRNELSEELRSILYARAAKERETAYAIIAFLTLVAVAIVWPWD